MMGEEFIWLLRVFRGKVVSGEVQMSFPAHLLLRSPTDVKDLNLSEMEKLIS